MALLRLWRSLRQHPWHHQQRRSTNSTVHEGTTASTTAATSLPAEVSDARATHHRVRPTRVHARAPARRRRREKAAFKGKELFDERDAAAREASEAAAKAQKAAEEARRDAEGCRRAQAIAAQAPDDEEVEIGDIRRL